mmetsp:Transcript_25154/g.57911  ORF Transcript_25154/g.57911 Transcript_25154/m.57911 type:complete len:323 (+) Transcript_25154:2141-3109(+)
MNGEPPFKKIRPAPVDVQRPGSMSPAMNSAQTLGPPPPHGNSYRSPGYPPSTSPGVYSHSGSSAPPYGGAPPPSGYSQQASPAMGYPIYPPSASPSAPYPRPGSSSYGQPPSMYPPSASPHYGNSSPAPPHSLQIPPGITDRRALEDECNRIVRQCMQRTENYESLLESHRTLQEHSQEMERMMQRLREDHASEVYRNRHLMQKVAHLEAQLAGQFSGPGRSPQEGQTGYPNSNQPAAVSSLPPLRSPGLPPLGSPGPSTASPHQGGAATGSSHSSPGMQGNGSSPGGVPGAVGSSMGDPTASRSAKAPVLRPPPLLVFRNQ